MPAKIKGAQQLQATLAKAGKRLEDMPPATHRRAGALVAAAVSTATPRRSGRLARSYRIEAGHTGAVVSSAVGYGGYVNYGTRHLRARRFVDRGLEAATEPVAELYLAEADKALAQVHGA